ncbi:hypothetical protein HOLleu_36979 [Holothuria leucospilota]|uniref:Uncharacterized protein n=1 Tax=Holothuria leucospilota TaxID=206669 RepID=A0A9Q0YKT6_HOLLE|nr:hypothetical protein HOLleu_36979 [Holothuria leucospilota]
MLKKNSSWTKAKRVLARCIIFICKLKKMRRSGEITVNEIVKDERFICRRGAVRQLRSGQGMNFIDAEAELEKPLKEMDQAILHDEPLKLNCDWVLNTPTASHHGGAWERMIRTTRSILNSIMLQHKALFNDEMLNTFMTEDEAIINSRPLTTTSEASVEPLTPAHFLTLKNSVVFKPPGKFVHTLTKKYCLLRLVAAISLFTCK